MLLPLKMMLWSSKIGLSGCRWQLQSMVLGQISGNQDRVGSLRCHFMLWLQEFPKFWTLISVLVKGKLSKFFLPSRKARTSNQSVLPSTPLLFVQKELLQKTHSRLLTQWIIGISIWWCLHAHPMPPPSFTNGSLPPNKSMHNLPKECANHANDC